MLPKEFTSGDQETRLTGMNAFEEMSAFGEA